MPATKRILMLCISDFQFLTPAMNEGKALAAAGYKVDVLTLGGRGQRTPEEVLPGFTVHRVSMLSRRLPKSPPFWLAKYIEYIVRAVYSGTLHRPDVLVAHNLDTLVPAVAIARILRCRLIYRAHELFSDMEDLPAAGLWKLLERRVVPLADVVVVPNAERADILERECAATRTVVVQNCPPYSSAKPGTLLRDRAHSLGVAAEKFVLFQGRLGDDRCTRELVDSVADYLPEIVLVLLGHAPADYMRRLRMQIANRGLEKRVLVLDPVPQTEVMSYTASADLGVVLYRNSSRNNFYCAPNKLFEYFMAGLPVVASNFPGLVRLVSDSGSGLLVDPESAPDIARAVNAILTNPTKSRDMRQAALANARIFNWEKESAKLLAVYKTLLPDQSAADSP